MILAFSLLTLLVVTNPAFAAVKGGRRIIQSGGGPQFLVGNGGIKSTGLGAGSAQYAISDGGFGQRLLYRTGQSQYPYGLMGNDYYSYPASLLTAPRRVLRRKTVAAPNLSGLRPIGFSSARNGAVLVDPSTAQFSIGDAQVKTGGYGLRRNLYRTGLSPVPYGLMGMDYYSYPKTLLTTQRRLSDDFGLGQTRILGGGSAFTSGDSQIRGAIASPQVSVLGDGLGDGFGQRKIVTTTVQNADPLSAALGQGPVTQTTVTKSVGGAGLRGGNIILNGGPAIRRVKSLGGFGQRQVVSAAPIVQAPVVAAAPAVQFVQSAPTVQVVQSAPVVSGGPVRRVITRRPGDVFLQTVSRPRVAALSRPVVQQRVSVVPQTGQVISSPVVVASSQPQVISQVKTSPSLFGRRVFGGSPSMYYVDGGNRYMGIDIIGGSRIGDPRFGYGRLAYNGGRFANLGLNQVRVPVGSFSSLDGQGSIDAGQTLLSPAPVTIVSSSPFRKSSPLVAAAPVAKTITQEETVGPLGDRQVVTTVTNSGSGLGGGKIGGLAAGGLAGIGQAPSQVVTQEQVVGPAGDPQILTTVTNTGSGLGGGKIGGLAAGSPLGFAGLSGAAPSKTITQEETVGPLGNRQVVTTVTNSGSGLGGGKIGGLAAGSPLGFAGLSGNAPAKTITQEEVVGPLGDRALVTTVTKSAGSGLGGGKIGGLAAGSPLGFAGLSGAAPAKTITQEETVGPLGNRQVVTTVTNSGSGLGGGKIGGLAAGSPLGFAGLSGNAPSKTITTEETVGPLGDRQVVTTVSNSGSGLGGGKIGGLAAGSPLGFAGLSGNAPAKTITQEEVVGPLGDRALVTTVTNSGSGLGGGKIGGLAAGSPLGFAGLSGNAPSKTITTEETVGPLGDRQVVTTVSNSESGLGGGKIGGLAAGSPLGFAGLSGNAPSKTITHEETVGPLGDRQVVTTVTNSGSGLGGGKIGGLATGGLAGIGQAPTQVVTQEQVVGPAGDPQILTTVTNTGSGLGSALAQEAIAQDPIESALVQEAIGGNLLSSIPSVNLASPLSQTVQSVVDPLSSGQVSLADDVISQSALSGSGLVRESSITDPFTGSVTKVTEVSQAPLGLSSGGLGGSLAQQNIADALVQESINPSIGGSLFGYEPRVSFLSQYPYDVPDSGLLRSVLASRPIIQQQQDEQILVK